MWLPLVLLATSAFGQGGFRSNRYEEREREQRSWYNNPQPGTNIVGGIETPLHQVPFLALVQTLCASDNLLSSGSGALIRTQWVLTALHVVLRDPDEGLGETVVWLGVNDKRNLKTDPYVQKFDTEVVYVPDSYKDMVSKGDWSDDIALIKLDRPALLTNYVNTIRIPYLEEKYKTFESVMANAAGWGKHLYGHQEGSSNVRVVNVTVISNAHCAGVCGKLPLRETEVCTTGECASGTCLADGGGPLYVHDASGRPLLIGITHKVARKNCESGLPSVYLRVSEFTTWINNTFSMSTLGHKRINDIDF